MAANFEAFTFKSVRLRLRILQNISFSGPPMDPAYLRHFLNSLKVSISLLKLGLCVQVLGLMSDTVHPTPTKCFLNVLCFQGENGDRGFKGEKGDSIDDFSVSGPPGLPGSPGLVVSIDPSLSSSSLSHHFP